MSKVLVVESVSKKFRIHRNRPVTLKEFLILRVTGNRDNTSKVLWALRDVSFSVEQGSTLGIIGHNGAGKSTLLRLICGLGRPTAGKIRCTGHVGSLLELGSGFNSEMTGRENLMTGGILSGLTKRQVEASRDEIIAFAELEEFIDQPVRTYSTGMYLRLAFATAIHFDPDFLVIDEVLAVGDTRFQGKCIKRLDDFRGSGKSLILVSHALDQIRALCDEVLVLEEGQVVMQGDPESAINCYYDLMRQRTERRAVQLDIAIQPSSPTEQGSRWGTKEATIDAVHLFDGQDRTIDWLYSGSGLTVELEYLLEKHVPDFAITLGIYKDPNIKCFETMVSSTRAAFGRLAERGIIRCHLPDLPLLPGRYFVTVGFFPPDWSYVYDYHWQMHPLIVGDEREMPLDISGVVRVRPDWSIRPKD